MKRMRLWHFLLILCIYFPNIWSKRYPGDYINRRGTDASKLKSKLKQNEMYIVRYDGKYKDLIQFSKSLKAKAQKMNANSYTENRVYKIYKFGQEMGLQGRFSSSMVNWLRKSAGVSSVEMDDDFLLDAVQVDAPWNLALTSQIEGSKESEFVYPDIQGEGVTVYVVDSGISPHPEFEDRMTWGGTFCSKCEKRDTYGHGTHIAGIIGAKTYGMAKKVQLVAVKVNEGFKGKISSVIQGLGFVVDHVKKNKVKKAIVNISGASLKKSKALDSAVDELLQLGIHVVTSAGNNNKDACTQSPSDIHDLITVASLNRQGKLSKYSNFGSCVDLFAPGQDINSTWLNNNTMLNQGTSTSAAHVTGALALLLSRPEEATPTNAKIALLEMSLKNKVVGDIKNTPNRVLNIASLNSENSVLLVLPFPRHRKKKKIIQFSSDAVRQKKKTRKNHKEPAFDPFRFKRESKKNRL